VGQAKRVPNLVSGELAQASERQLDEFRSGFVAVDERRRQSRGQQVVLANTERPERNVPLDDLPGSGIPHGRPVAPTARRPMDPLDDVVSHVHRVGAFREHLHAKGILESDGLEGLVPPAGAFEQCRAHRLGRPPVEVVDDGLDRDRWGVGYIRVRGER